MKPLAGRGIVITRPVAESAQLAELVRAAGGNPILFPGIAIVALDDPAPLLALINRLDRFDLAVFISPSAVDMAFDLIGPRRAWPPALPVAAVGAGSVRALRRHGITGVIAPVERFDSEALLELPPLQSVRGKNIVIFRGVGGRELLAETLTARGARTEYAECYRRVKPDLDPAVLYEAWARGELHAITATSSAALRNVAELVGPRGAAQFRATPCFVSHPRIGEAARSLGMSEVIVTGQGDQALVDGLIAWASGK
ncbi:MAG TPA: uroporphyrinogen-III synthase [Burkholderiales bacterium]|nr:uroporphyrinogen-III synthase [Burkholderiales bacterium]